MLTAHGVTHPGQVRQVNEDALIWDLELGLFVVADGMGGHNAGEVASRLAIDTIRTFLLHTRASLDADYTWPFGLDPRLSIDGNRLVTSLKLANRRVFKAGESREEYAGMGTTVVAALVNDARLTFCGVGDSRLYSFHDGSLRQLTRDDSWVATVLAQEVEIDRAKLASHPMRHVLTKVIGAREETDMDVGERALTRSERLLLCSDGLHAALDDGSIQGILAAERDIGSAASQLVQAALERNANDNITALVVEYGD